MTDIELKSFTMKTSGFTLIELMIVIATIAIIAAIAIPNLLRASISANEASAVASIRTVVTSQLQYITAGINLQSGVPQYGALSALGAEDPPYLDNVLGQANPVKSEYKFSLSLATGPAPDFEIVALPLNSRSGTRTFFVNSDGSITWLPGATDVPDSDSPALQ